MAWKWSDGLSQTSTVQLALSVVVLQIIFWAARLHWTSQAESLSVLAETLFSGFSSSYWELPHACTDSQKLTQIQISDCYSLPFTASCK